MKFRSIFQKIVIPMVLIVCIFAFSLLAIIGKLFKGTYETRIYEDNNNTADFVAQSVSGFMDKAYKLSESLANSEEILSMKTKKQTPLLENTVARNDYFELLYVQDMNGDQTGRSSGELSNRASRWWFIQMMETDTPFVSKSYYSVNTNMACASIFFPIKSHDKTIGIFASDIKLTSIQKTVEQFSNAEQGKTSFLIDGEGVVVAHPESVYYEELYNYKNNTHTVAKQDGNGNVVHDAEGNIVTKESPIEISEDYSSAIQAVMSGKSGSGQIKDNGKEYYISYAPVPLDGVSDSWSVITLQEKNVAMRLMDRIMNASVITTFLAVLLAILLILAISHSISSPIRKCLLRLELLSKGDLTSTVPQTTGKDESAQLLRALNSTILTMKKIIGDLAYHMNLLANGDLTGETEHAYGGEFDQIGDSLSKIQTSLNSSLSEVGLRANKVQDTSYMISEAAQSLAKDTASQADAAGELSVTIQKISEKITANASAADEANSKMKQVTREITAGNTAIGKLSDAMDSIYEDSQKINGITKLIQDIASQTNLLAMNASVEATRAGKAGESFAVVAGEIRSLADRCANASHDTYELITATLSALNGGMSILADTMQYMKNSTADTKVTEQLIADIAAATKEQAESITQILSFLEQISVIIQNNSAASEENASASESLTTEANMLKNLLQNYQYRK